MGSQLRWLERTPDKREVDGSIPFEPTNENNKFANRRIHEEIFRSKCEAQNFQEHIEKYIDE